MTLHTRILAGTALGLILATAPAVAAPATMAQKVSKAAPVLRLAQAETQTDEERRLLEEQKQEEQQEEKQQEEAVEEPPAGEAEAPPEPAEPQSEALPPPAEENQPDVTSEPEAAPEAEPAPEEVPAEDQPAPEEAEPAGEPQATEETTPEAQVPTEDAAEPERQPVQEETPPEAEPEPEETAPEESVPEDEAQPELPPAEETPQDELAPEQPKAATPPEAAPAPEGEPAPEAEQQPESEPQQTEPDAVLEEEGEPQGQADPGAAPEEAAQPEEEEPAPAGQEAQEPAAASEGETVIELPESEPEPREEAAEPAIPEIEIELPENAAPVLDSAKEAPAEEGTDQPAAVQEAPAEAPPPPPSDAAAQAEAVKPAEIRSLMAEEGRRVEREPDAAPAVQREGVEILRQFGDRVVIQFNNQIFVESPDRPRLRREAREVYYEELPRGLERETIIRRDGTRIVTIRNRYGDVLRRSRITPDGREYVLVYVREEDYDRVGDWYDPAEDLPPLVLTVPLYRYVLEAGRVDDPDVYYAFLDQPPIEPVRRLYSIDEVKRSARLRDALPRIELDTITFDFGSARIDESQIPALEGIARAMDRLLEENPGETFLIEGHTDAVGSDLANLALSDRRAEAVAEALTNVFGIPPENLVTQGYGERYLKVRTEAPERANRRVVIRRITPLVAPVASAR
jgi:outer membrane protein OmpA-like peptidoglycan-associated protein